MPVILGQSDQTNKKQIDMQLCFRSITHPWGIWMDLDQIEAFLVLTEELHFGRTAERMIRSQSRISRLIASFEDEIGGTLFARTNRRVALTPLGADLEARLRPAYRELFAARDAAQIASRAVTQIRIAFTLTTEGPELTRLIDAFTAAHPDCQVLPVEVDMAEPYGPLRRDEADVLFNWLVDQQPGFTNGPAIDRHDRVLAVARSHPLAQLEAVAAEQLGECSFARLQGAFAPAVLDAFYPRCTPSGRPIPRTHSARTWGEVLNLVGRGLVVHPTVTSVANKLTRTDIALLPITDLPPLPLGLSWLTSHENAPPIRALAKVARQIAAPPVARAAPERRAPGAAPATSCGLRSPAWNVDGTLG